MFAASTHRRIVFIFFSPIDILVLLDRCHRDVVVSLSFFISVYERLELSKLVLVQQGLKELILSREYF